MSSSNYPEIKNRLRLRHSSGVVHFFGKELNNDTWYDSDLNWQNDVAGVTHNDLHATQEAQVQQIATGVELTCLELRERLMQHVRKGHNVVFVLRRVQSASGSQVPLSDGMGVDSLALVGNIGRGVLFVWDGSFVFLFKLERIRRHIDTER